MGEVYLKEQFLKSAAEYLVDLKRASNFTEVVEIWRSTSIPYALSENDPYSPMYRQEILNLYNELTGCDYDVKNEWTSTLQDADAFERGYPWVSGNLAIIAEELAKPIQIMRALHELNKENVRVIEFGSGWGNLAIPLAKSGVAMTLVDIDQGFLDRAQRIADRDCVSIETICGDFLEVASKGTGDYDVVVFQSSFHHCLEFAELLVAVREKVLSPEGQIFFANEPISTELKFPWGLRYDGESLWAIMCNKWLELGFHHDFFVQLLLRSGFLPQALPELASLVDKGWRAIPARNLAPFGSLRLPAACSASFHDPDHTHTGCFSRGRSTLPPVDGSGMSGWTLQFVNYSLKPLTLRVGTGSYFDEFLLQSGQIFERQVETRGQPVVIQSETFIPHQQGASPDSRCLGIFLSAAALF